jgi:hypothetical protein
MEIVINRDIIDFILDYKEYLTVLTIGISAFYLHENKQVDGQVGFHRPENVRRVSVEKNNAIVKSLEKTKTEIYPHRNLAIEQRNRLDEIQRNIKENRRKEQKQERIAKSENKMKQYQLSYDRILTAENMNSTLKSKATVDTSAAEEFEDDFF